MSSLPITNVERSLIGVRVAAILGAVMLGALAIWTLAPEIVTITRVNFATNAPSTCFAAKVAIVRGDLWTECALGYADQLDSSRKVDPDNLFSLQGAHSAAEHALIFSPHDARAWLVLAAADSRLSGNNPQAIAALKMSYYTGADRPELMPLLLQISARSDALSDADLAQLFQQEIAGIVRREARLTPAIVTAYKNASPRGKSIIENVLRDHDPRLLGQLGSSSDRP
jgi:hypothetical protein